MTETISVLVADDNRRPSLRKGLYAVAALFIGSALFVLVAVTLVGNRVESVKTDIADDLRDKYGVGDVVVPANRHDGPTIWTIDGVERNCTYDYDDHDVITLKCLDGTGAYTEIGNAR